MHVKNINNNKNDQWSDIICKQQEQEAVFLLSAENSDQILNVYSPVSQSIKWYH